MLVWVRLRVTQGHNVCENKNKRLQCMLVNCQSLIRLLPELSFICNLRIWILQFGNQLFNELSCTINNSQNLPKIFQSSFLFVLFAVLSAKCSSNYLFLSTLPALPPVPRLSKGFYCAKSQRINLPTQGNVCKTELFAKQFANICRNCCA